MTNKTAVKSKEEPETNHEQLTFYIGYEPVTKEVKELDEVIKEPEKELKSKPKKKKKSVW
ncbi:hypothetical protein [Thermoanaerobacterium thermosaccharolyticum]|uniref:hypothetical protein n=1 Tax=Thermoanaerobacterium thermosaccharolyticum TaxID=1517 RepID=UPI00177BCFD7|nr:hypothetical protein [Thermoanaerobacterium thermosaccharolyticum]MBE0069716.1 hypothetical protein [Thermoanaerobacterium thermosaccharolyticum]MBE0229442.1 hypothetical protein [Thermoanaerobacterium thermosaccharolyticum]MCP2238992.1 hypothetical protein [Thermoanaerobacterium thermosaccharolyticum]